MNTNEKVALLWERFISRPDAYALMWYSEEKGVGYYRVLSEPCDQNPPCATKYCKHAKNTPITGPTLIEHLQGKKTVGTYQLATDNTVKWICLDVDVAKSAPEDDYTASVEDTVIKIATVIHSSIGRHTFLVERSGSKGYHVWLFFAEPIQAAYAKALGEWIVGNVLLSSRFITIEVFPKQAVGYAYGNLVKIPLGVHKKTGKRCFFVDSDFIDHKDQWERLSTVKTLTKEAVYDFLRDHEISVTMGSEQNEVETISFPCMSRMMSEGLQDGGRDIGLFRLAVFLQNRGLTEDLVLATLLHLNESRVNPPVAHDVVEAKVKSAFANSYSPFPCAVSAVDSFCSSSCRFFPKKLEARWTKYGRDPKEAVGVICRD